MQLNSNNYTERDRLNDNSFRSSLVTILKDIWIELRRSNELTETSNELTRKMHESFFQEQKIIEEDIDDAIGQAKNVNNNFNALNRKLESQQPDYDNHD